MNYTVKQNGVDSMEKTTLSVKIDKDLKQQAEYILSELGLNLPTAINIFLRAVVRHGGLPFGTDYSLKPPALEQMNKLEIDAKLKEGFASMSKGKGQPASEFFDGLN